MTANPLFDFECRDVRTYAADVVALKYAQGFFGADQAVAYALAQGGVDVGALKPAPGEHRLVPTRGAIRAEQALFVGAPTLLHFGYPQIREFGRDVLRILARELPEVRHLALTLHGPGYGLDEFEAALALFAGLRDAVRLGESPPALLRVVVVEVDEQREKRLRANFEQSMPGVFKGLWKGPSHIAGEPAKGLWGGASPGMTGNPDRVGIASESKPCAFVAMSFAPELDDVFFYGIQVPVRAADLLCERIDQTAFTGDVLAHTRRKIESAAVVVAELTGANANVYLEVGYAWGRNRPTILLVRDPKELRFDVRGQRCIVYGSIRELEQSLRRELEQLRAQRIIV